MGVCLLNCLRSKNISKQGKFRQFLKATTKPEILENLKRSVMEGHGIWRAQKSMNPELYINTVYLLLRDAKLLLRDSIITS